ncbi:anaphase-promoting complex subunit 1-like [Bicyclus anynana]|uniref:Anaphase-promoting complex subunit 1-like n=1 Tax=Bicyclus anynana TaxID=110368 RepID=A0ABM3LSG6_BICAN|nr:anaphase-promoting complex subunit 1-like [Bicyclus anynana]
MKAPCIIPELDTLRQVKICDPRYWPITFHRDHNWDQLKTFLDYTWCVDIKQRAGCLSYLDDPEGFLTILAQTLTLDKSNIWSTTTENIELFTNDEKVRNFVKHYLAKDMNKSREREICGDCLILQKKRKGVKNELLVPRQCLCRKYNKEEQEYVQGLSMVTYDCVVKDIMCALPIWTTFLKIMKAMKTEPTSYYTWQIKLLLSQIESHNKRASTEMTIDGADQPSEPLISTEFTLAIKQKIAQIYDKWEIKITPYLRRYLRVPGCREGLFESVKAGTQEWDTRRMFSSFVVYHSLVRDDWSDELSMALTESRITADAVSKISALLR